MSKINRQVGATSQILQVFIRDSSSTTGGGLTGLVFNSASLTAYYHRDTDTTATVISLVTMTVGTFTSSGFKEIDATNMPGWYQFCPPNAAFASGGASVGFHLKGATNMAPLPLECDLNPQSDVRIWNGTAVASPATAGIPDVNMKNMNNVATTSITTINANVGTTQPVNFTGTGASALAKSDMVDIAGAAVSMSTAQIGVNAVNLGGTAQTGRDLGTSVLLSSGTGTGQLDFTSGVVKANLAQILGTVLTETAGLLAGGFKKFFNISTPQATMDHGILVDTVTTTTTATNLTNAPTSGDFTATMKTSLNAATPSVTVSDKTGFSLSAAGIQAIWDRLTSVLTTVGSIGKLLVDNIDAAISSRLASASYTAPDNTTISTINTKIGTPVITVSTDIAGIQSDTDNIQTRLPAALVGGRIDASVGAYPGNTAQTGDNFARLGAPAGASVSVDIAAVKADIAAVPTANQNADALLDRSSGVETSFTPRQSLRLMLSALTGKLSGAATATVVIRNTPDTKNRITAAVDANGNRTAVTYDVS